MLVKCFPLLTHQFATGIVLTISPALLERKKNNVGSLEVWPISICMLVMTHSTYLTVNLSEIVHYRTLYNDV